MRIMIVDDEQLARDRLKRMLEEQSEHSVISEAADGQDALEKIEALHPDVVLLDIRMPGIDGLEVARHLVGMDEPPAVIFTTAYDDYALDAFKVNAVDYLLKPLRPEKLKEALNKAVKPNKLQWKSLNRKKDGTPRRRTHISSRTRKGIILVPVEDIYYFRAEHKYLTVRYKGGEVLIEETLKDLEFEFEDLLVRIHRNCLIARSCLQILERDKTGQVFIRLPEISETLEVSRRHLPRIREMMAR
jgi:two-component system, LytTR family, response regulator AlgR